MRILLLLIGLLPTFVLSHEMDQVKAQMEIGKSHWSAIVEIEGFALYPSDGPHTPDENVETNYAGMDWIQRLDRSEWEEMKETATGYLRDCFQLKLNGQSLPFDIEFLNFTTDPPEWTTNQKGTAVFRMRLHGKWQQGMAGPMELLWLDYSGEALSLQVQGSQQTSTAPLSVMRIETKVPTKLADITATGEVGETVGTSLWAWIIAGFEHIIPKGLDHILFILGLFFLQPKIRPLLWQSTAFTIAYSITLGLVVAGVFSISSDIVEPAIALSIAYVGFENIWVKELKPWRVGLVFGLGLLHGMGFASVMQELEIPTGSLLTPLLGFNVGVECGQLAVLASAFLLTFAFLRKPLFTHIRLIASVLIGITGLYWTVERIFL